MKGTGIIDWFAGNKIAANLLMWLILIGGAFGLQSMDREVFPTLSPGMVTVNISYPGAGPAEVEEQVTARVEEAIADIKGVKEVVSNSQRSHSWVQVTAEDGYDELRLLNDIKARVDSINTFPANIERPVIGTVEWENEVMWIAVAGPLSERELKATALDLRDRLTLLTGVRKVDVWGNRPDEMAIEVSELNLRRYNLSFDDVVRAVRSSSLDLPAGMVRSDRGDIQVQTRGQAYTADDFARIPVASQADGSVLLLSDVATVIDGYSEDGSILRFNGHPALNLRVLAGEPIDVVATSERIREFMDEVRPQLPPGTEFEIWFDTSKIYEGRMNLLAGNAITGLVLVFVLLMLFLRPALAMWVSAGIAVAFMGAFWLLPAAGVSLNMLSLFAFLLILGIVVDDAIIVGEAVHAAHDRGLRGLDAARVGVRQVSKPVLFAVFSTMVFFVPMLFLPGLNAEMMYSLPMVVLLCCAFSLVECLLILPSHLAGMKPEQPSRFELGRKLQRLRGKFSRAMRSASNDYYRPLLEKSLQNSRATVMIFVFSLLLSIVAFTGGYLPASFMPQVPSDMLRLRTTMAAGEPFVEYERVMKQFLDAADKLAEDPELLAENDGREFFRNSLVWASNNGGINVLLQLAPGEERDVTTRRLAEEWRKLIGEVPASVEDIKIHHTMNEGGAALTVNLSTTSGNMDELRRAADLVKDRIASYEGTYDVRDNLTSARRDIEVQLKPYASTLGIGLSDIAKQVRQGFYGEEAQRIPRGKEDVRVMVRYPRDERSSEDQIERIRLRTPQGEIPFSAVAEAEYVPGYTTIRRFDRERTVRITAELTPGTTTAQDILKELRENDMPEWKKQFPGFSLKTAGEMQEQQEFGSAILAFFVLSVFVIYGLLAIAFRSYSQPLLILTAVPFGFFGAVVGHVVMGFGISMMSVLGIMAAAGVVVNDNLVLVDRINQLREQGLAVLDAVTQAASDRFRPIILTSLTTFIGLVPIMFERSIQAQFLIPTVVSLAFGVLCATAVTLILVPNLYKVTEILRAKVRRRPEGEPEFPAELESA